MANLFFIHTPLQLLVAQQIIRQEQLKDNVMLYGYVDDNVHFLQLYELTVIDSLWSAKVAMPKVARWAIISRKHLLRDCQQVWQNYCIIKKIICDYNITTLFLGDMKNMSCQLAAMSFHKKGLKICFFEEGSGHYVMDYGYGISGGLKDKIYSVLIDLFYYRPLYGVYFGHIRYWKGFTLSDLTMDVRYSLVPFYHDPFDRLITYQPMFSNSLKTFLEKETSGLDTNGCTLLLTSPFYINGIDDDPIPYVKTIIENARKLCKKGGIHIKFHPRETQEVRRMIQEQLDEEGIRYLILGTKMNIPVEYYLQYIHYDQIVMFLCSTAYYNGYLFPKTQFVSLLRDYLENCKAVNSPNVKYIENIIKNEKSLSLS